MPRIKNGTYTLQELMDMIGIQYTSKNKKQNLKNKLTSLGYIVEDGGRGKLTITGFNEAKTAPKKPSKRAISFDFKQLTGSSLTEKFACHIYLLLTNENKYQIAPNPYRADVLLNEFGLFVDDITLIKWNKRLAESELFTKEKYKENRWKTYYKDNESIREEATDEEWKGFFGTYNRANDMRTYENYEFPEYMPEKAKQDIIEAQRKSIEALGGEKGIKKIAFAEARSKYKFSPYLPRVVVPNSYRQEDLDRLLEIVTPIAEKARGEKDNNLKIALKEREEREAAEAKKVVLPEPATAPTEDIVTIDTPVEVKEIEPAWVPYSKDAIDKQKKNILQHKKDKASKRCIKREIEPNEDSFTFDFGNSNTAHGKIDEVEASITKPVYDSWEEMMLKKYNIDFNAIDTSELLDIEI